MYGDQDTSPNMAGCYFKTCYKNVDLIVYGGLKMFPCPATFMVCDSDRYLTPQQTSCSKDLAMLCDPALQEDCASIMKGRFMIGDREFTVCEVQLTPAYGLSPYTKYIIHAMAPCSNQTGGSDEEHRNWQPFLFTTVCNCLSKLESFGCSGQSIAFPILSKDIFCGNDGVIDVLVQAVARYIDIHENKAIDTFYFLGDDECAQAAFKSAILTHMRTSASSKETKEEDPEAKHCKQTVVRESFILAKPKPARDQLIPTTPFIMLDGKEDNPAAWNYRHDYPVKNMNDERLNANTRFYAGKIRSRATDGSSSYIDDFHRHWFGDYQSLENNLQYFDWLFPIRGAPAFNCQAQELQPHEGHVIRRHAEAQARFLKSIRLMLDFYGLKLTDDQQEVAESENHSERMVFLAHSEKFHATRISRIIQSMGLLGYEHLQAPFVRCLLIDCLQGNLYTFTDACMREWIPYVLRNRERQNLIDLANYIVNPP